MTRRLVPLLENALTLLGIGWLAAVFLYGRVALGLLLVWNIAAVAYMAAVWILLQRRIPDGQFEADALQPPRWQATTFALVASGSGLAGGMLTIASRESGLGRFVAPMAVATVLLSWCLLHTAFAQIYARDFYTDAGLAFPECARPQLTEFVYFSFTVGTSFAVSDATVTSRPMRRRVIAHAVLSFFFNAALVAIAMDWIKG